MNYKSTFLFLAGLCYMLPAVAQQEDEYYGDVLEEFASQSDESIEDDSRMQTLEGFVLNPLNLNVATADDLRTFFFLNNLQIHSFLSYRDLMGPLISIYELQAVPQWNLSVISRILPYVSVNKKGMFASDYSLSELIKKGGIHLLLRYKRDLEEKKGYKPKDSTGTTHYLGSPNAAYFRIQYKFPGYMNIGVTAEIDAGEPFSGYGQKGFDFYSAHLYLENRGLIKSLALGDYRINLGQGLINKQGLSFGKTGMVMMIDRSGKVISPHTSAMEFGFYRGAAVSIGKKRWSTTLFLSRKTEDANLLSEDTSYSYFHSLQSIGYHRSLSELENKNSVKLYSTGGNIRYDFEKGHIALNMVYHRFSDSMKRTTQPYQLFNPEGIEMLNASVDYALFLNKLYFFGETATNKKGAFATINGLQMSVDRNVDISLLYRDYTPEYTSLYSRAFGESSRPQNEKGFYAGMTVRLAPHWELDGYSDFFRSDWLRYRVDMPSIGKEHFLQLNYKPSKKFRVYARYRYKNKPINVLKNEPLAEVVDTRKQNVRVFMEWELSDYFRIRDQVEWSQFKKGEGSAEQGYMFYQNVRWKANRVWSGNGRIGYFNTDGYDSRIYTFENNVRYTYYIPSFYGEGIRAYINLRINIGRRLSLWSKISRTWYFNRDKIGSGWNEIDGNKQTKLTLELIWE